ncbi:DNA-processing protein DprA [Terrabacter lapilli]|uniref:DNA-processing protein DprA n=1 Tax=Terrabacter lapilli TaxID=436231 RepID=A0ABP5CW49_9MICO
MRHATSQAEDTKDTKDKTADSWKGRCSMDADRFARAALSRLAEPCDREVRTLLDEVGAPEAVARIRAGRGTLGRFRPRVASLDTERDLDIAAKVGARVVVPGDDEWPERLGSIPVPPYCLWVRGPLDLAETVERSVAVVGSRTATAYGEQVAADLAAGLAQRGWSVVSGAAFGIDGSAHRGALAVDGATVAVLAGGVERPYPSAHATLIARIARDGLVVSEVAPGSAPMKSRFLARNRLIAGMTRGTVVVEADLRSGSRNTVKHAIDAGRNVGAVPGPITSMTSSGCHQEIRDGRAVLVTSASEVIDLVGDLGDDACEPARGPVLPEDALPSLDASVLEAVPFRSALPLDAIVRSAAQSPLAVRAALGRLERLGLVTESAGTWRKRPQRRLTAAR